MATVTENRDIGFNEQLDYLKTWFENFSEIQRSDFGPLVVAKLKRAGSSNGPIPEDETMSPSEHPLPSIFTCRMTLFCLWAEKWTRAEWEEFCTTLQAIDPQFVAQFDAHLPALDNMNVL